VNPHRERGAAAVELAFLLPILAFLFAAAVPVVQVVLHHTYLNQLSQAGARYATRSDVDPTDTSGSYGLRRSPGEVEAWIQEVATDDGRIDPATLTVTVQPDPEGAFPNTPITVTVRAPVSLGFLGDVANGVADMFMDEPPLPSGDLVLQSTATMRKE
jgi:Flp pilus assembly protein TadG